MTMTMDLFLYKYMTTNLLQSDCISELLTGNSIPLYLGESGKVRNIVSIT